MNIGTFVSIGWIAFWAYWIISAFGAKRNIGSKFSGFRFGLLIIAVLIINRKLGTLNVPSAQVSNSGSIAIGLILFVAGLLFAIWARVHLGKNWGSPMSQKQETQLVTSGPYSFVRHPIYTGVLLAMLGTALAISYYWLIIFVITGTFFIYSATVEEKRLAKIFPADYPSYKKRTRMLLPFVF